MRVPSLLPLLTVTAAVAQQVQPQPANVVPQPAEGGRLVWHSRTFRIDSDQPIPERSLQRLAQVADTTAAAVRSFPLPISSPPEGGRPRIALYSNDEAYLKAGANPGTAGTYHRRHETVLLHTDHLFRSGASARLGPEADEDLVVHELVHLCMHRVQPRLPQWLCEGIAEYFAVAHRGAGRFDFRDLDPELVRTIRKRLATQERRVAVVAIADLAGLDDHDWTRYQEQLVIDDRYRAYATGLLLTHYYLHGSEERRGIVKAALDASPGRFGGRDPFPDLKDEAPAIQSGLVRYWKTRGIELEFMEPNPLPPRERFPRRGPR